MWLLFFPAPNSFTGEDVLELHLPSSRPLLDDFLKRFQAGDFRLAEPGEFSRRAFLNGRLDLTQAEGILDLVQSRTVAQAQAATKALAGDLGNHVQVACDLLFDAMVQVEASLDFEEGDSQDLRPGEIYALLESAEKSLRDGETFQKQHLVRLSDEWTIVLAGAPNAGKTTLFQTLTKKEALVSPQPGTTRDARRGLWPSASDGLPWVLVDGPGLGGAVVDERDFLARKRFEADKFDMLWWVVDRSKPDPPATLPWALPSVTVLTHAGHSNRLSADFLAHCSALGPVVWLTENQTESALALRAATQAGVDEAGQQIRGRAGAQARTSAALQAGLRAVRKATALLDIPESTDLVAEELRAGVLALGELVGDKTPEDLLDQLFGEFCVGK
jgi:tRNA modification GTPase